ncbi:hypothetical protein Y032_0014g2468 [Ancylostoma ceylanicum]|uniref:Uncharacterized protein n=1 Tax=Ancylostoma ceylanicum TaxID=53326 RepID=A0A016VAR6_9BILA|nr:hypothetical protein Y032_0014g2468 [Ancylostoma ceylanicum]
MRQLTLLRRVVWRSECAQYVPFTQITRTRLRHLLKSGFVSCIFRVFHAVSFLPMSSSTPKKPEFEGIFNATISAVGLSRPSGNGEKRNTGINHCKEEALWSREWATRLADSCCST